MRNVDIFNGIARITIEIDSASACEHAAQVLRPKVEELGDLRVKLQETLEEMGGYDEAAAEALDLDIARMQFQVKELQTALQDAGRLLTQDHRLHKHDKED